MLWFSEAKPSGFAGHAWRKKTLLLSSRHTIWHNRNMSIWAVPKGDWKWHCGNCSYLLTDLIHLMDIFSQSRCHFTVMVCPKVSRKPSTMRWMDQKSWRIFIALQTHSKLSSEEIDWREIPIFFSPTIQPHQPCTHQINDHYLWALDRLIHGHSQSLLFLGAMLKKFISTLVQLNEGKRQSWGRLWVSLLTAALCKSSVPLIVQTCNPNVS